MRHCHRQAAKQSDPVHLNGIAMEHTKSNVTTSTRFARTNTQEERERGPESLGPFKAAVQSPTGQCTATTFCIFGSELTLYPSRPQTPNHLSSLLIQTPYPPPFFRNRRRKMVSQYPSTLPLQITIVTAIANPLARVIPIFISFASEIIIPIVIPINHADVITIISVVIAIAVPNRHLSPSLALANRDCVAIPINRHRCRHRILCHHCRRKLISQVSLESSSQLPSQIIIAATLSNPNPIVLVVANLH